LIECRILLRLLMCLCIWLVSVVRCLLFWMLSLIIGGVIGRCLVMVWVIFIVWLKEVRMILVFFCWVYCFMVWMLLLMCIILFVVVGN